MVIFENEMMDEAEFGIYKDREETKGMGSMNVVE